MALQQLDFQPGVNKEATDYSAKGGWVDGNLIRFRKGRVEKSAAGFSLVHNIFLVLAEPCILGYLWLELDFLALEALGNTT